MQLRDYQKRSLEALEEYLKLCPAHGAKLAFMHRTERPYKSVPQLPELPYVCLRVPTGGGKTLMACHALGIVAREYLHSDRAVCLWLVPSNAIREQTLSALRDRKHPYRRALEDHFNGQVSVLDLTESLYVQRGTLAGETTVIVSTLQALRRDDTEGLKVYESAGALQHHFSALTANQEANLERRDDGTIPYSLCNVLRLWRPVVLMDEAHNARTKLSFDTLARFNPSGIIEFTATPELEHDPERGYFASNVLHHVSAAELKAEEMVKLPIRLETRAEWKEVVGQALKTQRELEATTKNEEQHTGEYIRPIVLFQAQPKSQTKQTLTVEVVKQSLLADFKVPEDQIAVATGATRELDGVNLFDRTCPIRFIITVQALKEGWDCSFAYVLCSVAEMGSTTAVEQLLGRILRMPYAKRKRQDALNLAYAFVASPRFIEAAKSLKDALLENGFQRIEANELVQPAETPSLFDDAPSLFGATSAVVEEKPNLTGLKPDLRERIEFDESTGTLTVTGEVSEADAAELGTCFRTAKAKRAVEQLQRESKGRPKPATGQKEQAVLRVPALAIRRQGLLEFFEESHFLDSPWKLSERDATLSEAEYPSTAAPGQTGELDVSDKGKLEIRFVRQVQQQLWELSAEPGWDVADLTNWLDRQIPHPDITRTEATLFIDRVLTGLMAARMLTVEQLAEQKFRLRRAVADKIDRHRDAANTETYQRLLFSPGGAEIEVGPEICFELSAGNYSPNWYYEGSYKFQRHLLPLVGELKPDGEETDCAIFLDQLAGVKHWIRNLERRPDSSFWLQTATDKFYPDFVVLLTDGRFLVVEYKGADRWSNDDSKEKRTLGMLWESRSNGRCLFVMPNGPDMQAIRAKVTGQATTSKR